MKCTNCGMDIPENENVCGGCGTEVLTEAEQVVTKAAGEAEQAVAGAADEAEQTVAEAAGEAEQAVAETAGEAEQVVAEAAGEAEEAEQTVAEAAGEAEQAVTEAAGEAEQVVAEAADETAQAVTEAVTELAPRKKSSKPIIAAVAAVAVVGAGAFGIMKLTEKDPRQVVIDAFEGVYADGQVSPVEELFGSSQFAETAMNADSEMEMTFKLDSSTDETINAYAGSGIGFDSKTDMTNMKSSARIAAIYNNMDLVTINGYYGDDVMMISVPELTQKVLTLDLGDGLEQRIAESPLLSQLTEENGMDVAGMAQYYKELIDQQMQAREEGKTGIIDLEGIWNRYQEGCQAQENFKAALTVTKAEGRTFTVDGQEVSCKGYETLISKDSMIAFLRTSSDFFLQDEQLKNEYLKQLEMTVKMSQFMGGSMGETPSAEELQKQSYEEITESVNELIDTLDKTLHDITMMVYVDKKGNLAAFEGTTMINDEDGADSAEIAFHVEVQGGVYRTQNAQAEVVLTNKSEDASPEDVVTISLIKQGTYDGKQLTADVSLDVKGASAEGTVGGVYTGTYQAEDGSYHVQLEVAADQEPVVKVSMEGVVDQLEKGKSIHTDIDALSISIPSEEDTLVISGEYAFRPLSGEVTPLEGTTMDVLAATEEDWQNLMMEFIMSIYGLMSQLGA